MGTNQKRDYFWNTLGVLLQNAISPLLIVVVTRVNGVESTGLFSFAFSIAIIFWTLAMWGGRTYQVSDTKKLFKAQSYIVVRVVLAVVVLLSALLFCAMNSYEVEKISIIMMLVGLKVVESIADAIYGVLQINDNLHLAGKSLVYKSTISSTLFIIVDIVTRNIAISSLMLIVTNIIVVVLYDIPKARALQGVTIDKANINLYMQESLEIMKKSFSVCMVSFLGAFSLNIPRYFIDIHHHDQLGYFGIIATPVTLVVLLVTFILQPNIVRLSRYLGAKKYDDFNKEVFKMMCGTFGIGLGVLIAMYTVGAPLLSTVFGVDFSEYRNELVVITFGALASALVAIFTNMLIIMRKLTIQMYILLFMNVTVGIFSYFCIRNTGTLGAVVIYTCSSLVQASLLGVVYAKNTRGELR
jgi:O-antigen/teichoic acid export membrane protein